MEMEHAIDSLSQEINLMNQLNSTNVLKKFYEKNKTLIKVLR